MIIRVVYNEHGPHGRKIAEEMVAKVREILSDINPIMSIRTTSLATDEDRVTAEVAINFMGDNYAAANAAVERLEKAGIAARTFHDND